MMVMRVLHGRIAATLRPLDIAARAAYNHTTSRTGAAPI